MAVMDAFTAQTDRRVMLLRFLLMAVDEVDARGPESWPHLEDPGPPVSWRELVTLACQFGKSNGVQPAEFDEARDHLERVLARWPR